MEEVTWEALFRKWAERILDSGWDLNIVADRAIQDVYAKQESIPANRRASIWYNPERPPRNDTACHEICHIAVSHLELGGQVLAEVLTEPAKALAVARLEHETEETVGVLVRAFLKVYGESEA